MANTGVFGGGMELLPMAEVDDGRLDVLLTKEHPKWRYLRGLTQVFSGTHLDPRFTEVMRAVGGGDRLRSPLRRVRRRRPDRPHARHGDGEAALPAGTGAGVRLALGRLLARLARAVSRVVGRTGGTTVPGRVLLRVDPEALAGLSERLDEGSLLVSATNGKTTTSAMLSACLGEEGRAVVHNRAGSNMAWGVGTALLDAGDEPGQLGLFEVDEAWLPRVAQQVDPKLILLSNLFRDQLDRYGELELLADRWAEVVAAHEGRARFVLCADDPLVADLGRERSGVTYFGLEDDSQALPELQHAADSKHCRNCGHAYVYDAVYLGHLGRWHCPNCGRARPEPQVVARRVTLEGMSGSRLELSTPAGDISARLPLPGPLQRLQRGGRRRDRAGAGRAPWAACRPHWRASARRSGGWRRSPSKAATCRSCWSRTPPARTRCCARWRWRRARSTCGSP